MNVILRASVLAVAVAALVTPVLAARAVPRENSLPDPGRVVAAFAAFGSGPDVLLSKKFGQSDRDFKRACDKRDGLVTKRAGNVVCVARMHAGSLRGSYGGGRARSLPDETVPPQAQPPHG